MMAKDTGVRAGSRASHHAPAGHGHSASIPDAEWAFWFGVRYAAGYLADYARKLGGERDWPVDSIGWPSSAEGAERRGYHVFAGLIEEAVEAEGLSPVLLTFAQAIEARRAETGTGSVHESAVPEGDAP
jgi:hypothetical protein